MPNSNDNQDLEQGNESRNNHPGINKDKKENHQEDENNFTSDNLKGKKVDADPLKESEKPADVDV